MTLRVELNGLWEIGNPRTGGVWTGSVPGFVQHDLMMQKDIPDVWDTLFEVKVEWIEQDDWVYTRSFELPESLLDQANLDLVFDGIDTFAQVTLNGVVLGRTENMFVSHRFPVKGIAQVTNTLEVRIDSPTRVLAEKEQQFGETLRCWNTTTHRLFGRKAQYGYSWDWGPKLATVGIHKGVWVEGYQHVQARTLRYNMIHLDADVATLDMILSLSGAADPRGDGVATVHYWVYDDDDTLVSEVAVPASVKPGIHEIHTPLSIQQPQHWYPNGYGQQPLYRVVVEVRMQTEVSHLERRIGLRQVEILQPLDEQGRKFFFQVNGQPILAKGVNWIPLTVYPGLDARADYEREIAGIRQANMNMIRVWGGGYYENQDFYELCDEQGIMVWQDFMFACGDYPDDAAFCALVDTEVKQVIDTYAYHPSIVVWCGNNENGHFLQQSRKHRPHGFAENIYFDLMPDLCAADNLRPYRPSSPFNYASDQAENDTNYGDQHFWAVWGGLQPYEAYAEHNGRFVSEFGMQSYPSVKVLQRVDGSADYRDPQFEIIQKAPYGNARLAYYVKSDYHLPKRKEDYVYLSQLMQANALCTGMEHWLGRMPDTAGALVWQWNDLWPSISWAMVDFEKVPKASFYQVKRLFQSPNVFLSIARDGKSATVKVIHDSGPFTGEWSVEAYDVETDASRPVASGRVEAAVSGVSIADQLNLSAFDKQTTVLLVRLIRQGTQLARRTYLLVKPKEIRWKPAVIKASTERVAADQIRVTLTTDVFAKDVFVPNLPEILEDNCFDLVPHEPKIILWRSTADFPTAELLCLNNIAYLPY